MSYQFDFDSTNRILRGRFEGRITAEELTDYLETVGHYIARTDPRGGVTDLSAVTTIEATFDAIRGLASLKPTVPLLDRTRVVLAASDHVYGIARMFEIEAEFTWPDLHVVRTWNEAGAILGVREFHFAPIQTEWKPC